MKKHLNAVVAALLITVLALGTVITAGVAEAAVNAGTSKGYVGFGEGFNGAYGNLAGNNWMSGIPDDRKINEINMPGTHDSAMNSLDYEGTFGGLGVDQAKTQSTSIETQLSNGVRRFDLRLTEHEMDTDKISSGNTLHLCHGTIVDAGILGTINMVYFGMDGNNPITLEKAMEWYKTFLRNNPTETIIVQMKTEVGDDNTIYARAKNILDAVYGQTNPSTGKSYIYTQNGSKKPSSLPTLGECRGQMLIVNTAGTSQRDKMGYGYGVYLGNKSSSTSMGGTTIYYDNSWEVEASSKRGLLETLFFSTYNHSIPRDLNSHLTAGINAYSSSNVVSGGSLLTTPEDIADDVNPTLKSWYNNNIGKYFGWVDSDFVDATLASALWKTNFPSDLKHSKVILNFEEHDNQNVHYTMMTGDTYTLPSNPFSWPSGTGTETEFAGWNVDGTTYQPGSQIKLTADTIATAWWKFPVKFDMNGHGTAPATQKVEKNGKASQPSAPTATGYVFGGWYADKNCTQVFDFDSAIKEETTIYAKWRAKDAYQVTVTEPKGSTASATTVSTDAVLTNKGTFGKDIRQGAWYQTEAKMRADVQNGTISQNYNGPYTGNPAYYGFAHILMDGVGGGEIDLNRITVDLEGGTLLGIEKYENSQQNEVGVTLLFQVAAGVVVDFDMNGHGTTPASQTISAAGKATQPAAPSADGYEFGGWYGDKACTQSFDFNTSIQQDTTIYAKWWVKDDYQITVSPPKGTTASSVTVYTDVMLTDKGTHGKAVKKGGWYQTEAKMRADVQNGTIRQNYNGPYGGDTIYYGYAHLLLDQVGAEEIHVEKLAVTLTGGSLLGKEKYVNNQTQEKGVTIFFSCTTDYMVSFDMNGHGTAPEPQTVKKNNRAEEPEQPAATGYVFGGWYEDRACTIPFSFTKNITANTVLYAKWMPTDLYRLTVTPPDARTTSGTTVPTTVTFDEKGHHGKSLHQGAWYETEAAARADVSERRNSRSYNGPYEGGMDYFGYVHLSLDGISAAEINPDYFDVEVAGGSVTAVEKYEAESGSEAGLTIFFRTTTDCIVEFNLQGQGDPVEKQIVRKNGNAAKPENPEAKGYVFENWYTDKDCTQLFDFSKGIEGDLTLYARWLPKDAYQLTVEPPENGASGDDVQTAAVLNEAGNHGSGVLQGFWYETEDKLKEDLAANTSTGKFKGPYAGGRVYWGYVRILLEDVAARDVVLENFDVTMDGGTVVQLQKYDADGQTGITVLFQTTTTCVVTFDMGGHGTAPEPQIVEKNETIEEPDTPSAEGYVFGGWYADEGFTTIFDFTDGITKNTTVYGRWLLKETYQISVAQPKNDGSSQCDETEVSLDEAGTCGEGIRQGFWYETEAKLRSDLSAGSVAEAYAGPFAGGARYYGYAHILLKDVTVKQLDVNHLKATLNGGTLLSTEVYEDTEGQACGLTVVFELVKHCEITFDTKNHGSEIETQIVAPGGRVEEPDQPEATGFIFGGWYEDVECSRAFDFTKDVEYDLTLYARWLPKGTCRVAVQPPENGYQSDQIVYTEAQLVDNGIHDVQLEQGVWYETEDSMMTGISEADLGEPFRGPFAGGQTYYGFTRIIIDGTTAADVDPENFDIALDGVIYLSKKKYEDEEAQKSGITVLYSYTVPCIVKYHLNGLGNAMEVQIVHKDGHITVPKEPKADGYIFDGWYKDADCTEEFDFMATITSDTTLYAKWIEVKEEPLPDDGKVPDDNKVPSTDKPNEAPSGEDKPNEEASDQDETDQKSPDKGTVHQSGQPDEKKTEKEDPQKAADDDGSPGDRSSEEEIDNDDGEKKEDTTSGTRTGDEKPFAVWLLLMGTALGACYFVKRGFLD